MSLCRANYATLVLAATFAVGVASSHFVSSQMGIITGCTANTTSGQGSGRSSLPETYGMKILETVSDDSNSSSAAHKPFKTTFLPKPGYTDEARINGVQGDVVLRVTFLASGDIGEVEVLKELPDGLTEKAIDAARKIKFEPREDNGVKKSVIRSISYSFTIY
ncbi:MAG: energy transducer TonB [Acidobacteria bacterium]|nr:energy transducer TonB [Acidobacteriota bacterium]